MKHPSLFPSVVLLAGLTGLVMSFGAGCKRANGTFALDPLDATGMASCNSHGPLNRTCNECNTGDTRACITVAQSYERRFDLGRSDRDSRSAALFYGRACEQGHEASCVFIGDYYSTVRGLEFYTREIASQLRSRACETVSQACAANDALACRVEGMCLGDEGPGQPQPRDPAGAQRAFTSSCELGDPLACARLGWMRDATADSDAARGEALAAYQKACDAEVVEGCLGVAAHKFHGLGTPRAPAEAVQLADEWCGRGSPQACQAVQGRFSALWPILARGDDRQGWSAPDPQRIQQLELRGAWTSGVGRTGFCVRPDGSVEGVSTVDSTGDLALDQVLRDTITGWRFKAQPTTSEAPMCLIHEQRLILTFRSGFARPFYVVQSSWITPRGGIAILDFDRMRPSR